MLRKVNEIIKESYKKMGKELVDNFDINNSDTYMLKNYQNSAAILQGFQAAVKNQQSGSYQYATRTIKKVEQELNEVIRWINSNKTNKNLPQLLNQMNTNIENIYQLQNYLNTLISNQKGKYQSGESLNITMITKGLAGSQKINIMQSVNNLHFIYMGLVNEKKQAKLSSTDIGDIFEIALAAASALVGQTANNITDIFIQDFIDGIVKASKTKGNTSSQWKGKVAGDRIGFTTDLTVDFNKIGVSQDKENGNIVVPLLDGSEFRIKYIGGKNEIKSSLQGKIDIEYDYKLNDTISPLRLSAKNWDSQFGKHNFNTSDLLNTLSNSLRTAYMSDTILNVYLMSLQHPQTQKYNLSYRIWDAAHHLAIVAIAADILMGISQKQGYANLIAINFRGQKIKVIDIIDELNKYNTIWQGYYTKVEGYDSQALWRTARSVKMATIRGKWESSDSSNYYAIMRNFLKSQSVTVKYTG